MQYNKNTKNKFAELSFVEEVILSYERRSVFEENAPILWWYAIGCPKDHILAAVLCRDPKLKEAMLQGGMTKEEVESEGAVCGYIKMPVAKRIISLYGKNAKQGIKELCAPTSPDHKRILIANEGGFSLPQIGRS